MTRFLTFLICLSASAIVLAQPLYKWVEPDGSITFSVTPPAAGTRYETINPSGKRPTTSETASRTEKTVEPPALKKALPANSEISGPTKRLAPLQESQQTARATADRQTAAQAEYAGGSSGRVIGAAANRSGNSIQNAGRSAALNAKSRKQRQCEDLKKRVISLEGRLRTRLTPDDMDNTVVHMARYQRSYDQHCVQ